MASLQRQPFGELGFSRLQGLNAQKNCQNAITDLLSKPNSSAKSSPALSSPVKRSYAPVFEDEDFDTENVDPALSFPKRSKGLDGKVKHMPTFNINIPTLSESPVRLVHTPSSALNKPVSPSSPLQDKLSLSSLPGGTSSAPAGRSPKHKRVGILSRKRPSGSPFRRIDPPRFGGAKKSAQTGLPFSIDAALNGTLADHTVPSSAKAAVPALDESSPKGWFFEIHEDTPEEDAANMMEHSTCILDISSDDECGPSKISNDRGKENVPPPDHEISTASSQTDASVVSKPRQSAHVDDMVDEGQDRAPLGLLPAEDFYANGLDARSVEVVPSEHDDVPQAEEVDAPILSTQLGNPSLEAPVADMPPMIHSAEEPKPPFITVHEDDPVKAAEAAAST